MRATDNLTSQKVFMMEMPETTVRPPYHSHTIQGSKCGPILLIPAPILIHIHRSKLHHQLDSHILPNVLDPTAATLRTDSRTWICQGPTNVRLFTHGKQSTSLPKPVFRQSINPRRDSARLSHVAIVDVERYYCLFSLFTLDTMFRLPKFS
jgi:hypothetical protein